MNEKQFELIEPLEFTVSFFKADTILKVKWEDQSKKGSVNTFIFELSGYTRFFNNKIEGCKHTLTAQNELLELKDYLIKTFYNKFKQEE